MALSSAKRLSKLAQKKSKLRKLQRYEKLLLRYTVASVCISLLAFIIWHSDVKPTSIGWFELFLIGLIGGAILSIPVLCRYRNIGSLILVLILGSFSANVFLLINQVYANGRPIESIKQIVTNKRERHVRFSTSYWVDIKYNGKVKNFEITEEELPNNNYITLTVKKGYFGYAFIDKYAFTAE